MNDSQQPKSRSSFWLAFAISFVILAVASCGGVAMMIGLSPGALAELQSSGPVWTPPPTPTAPPADMTAPAAAPSAEDGNQQPDRLQPGAQARNAASSLVNIRRAPGYLGKAEDDIVAQMPPGTIITILDLPQMADQLIWWPIRYASPNGPIEGWVAESTAGGVLILAPE